MASLAAVTVQLVAETVAASVAVEATKVGLVGLAVVQAAVTVVAWVALAVKADSARLAVARVGWEKVAAAAAGEAAEVAASRRPRRPPRRAGVCGTSYSGSS